MHYSESKGTRLWAAFAFLLADLWVECLLSDHVCTQCVTELLYYSAADCLALVKQSAAYLHGLKMAHMEDLSIRIGWGLLSMT